MNQQAVNVVDLAAYRERRNQHFASGPSAFLPTQPAHFLPFPVMLPVIVGWFPVWMPGVALAGDAVDR